MPFAPAQTENIAKSITVHVVVKIDGTVDTTRGITAASNSANVAATVSGPRQVDLVGVSAGGATVTVTPDGGGDVQPLTIAVTVTPAQVITCEFVSADPAVDA